MAVGQWYNDCDKGNLKHLEKTLQSMDGSRLKILQLWWNDTAKVKME